MIRQTGVRVRFAPSPTGHLHIGGLRTAIFNWLYARHNNGAFLLRIEDTDVERSKQEYTDSILASFAWMHLNWDEPIIIQSQRAKRHADIARLLYEHGKAYYCICSQEQLISRLSQQPNFDPNFLKYDGYCKMVGHTAGAMRFKIPSDITSVNFDDMIRGSIEIGIDQLDDFIIVRSDGTPMYNFVVVIDDADMRISHVIRGEEHIANTPKQVLLYQACNFTMPQFAHLPMILGPDGSKLSKRDAATGVHEYQHNGYLPEALFNYLVRLGWAHGDQEVFNRQEMIKLFTLDHVSKKGAIFDQQKLDWINALYIRQMPDQELLEIMVKDLHPSFLTDVPTWHNDTVLLLINIFKQRVKTLKELADEIIALHNPPRMYNAQDIAQWIAPSTRDDLHNVITVLETIEPFAASNITHVIKAWVQDQNKKIVSVAQPLRLAMLGKSNGPGVFELISALGKHECIERIQNLIRYIDK